MNPRGWSLTTQLIASVVALFAVVTLLTGAATVLVMRQQLVQQIDEEITRSAAPVADADGPAWQNPCSPERRGPADSALVACFADGLAAGYVADRGELRSLTPDQLDALESVDTRRRPTTVDVEGVGDHRVVSVRSENGTQVVIGESLDRATNATRALLTILAATSIAGLAATGFVGSWLIRRGLLPLRRVAATAERVSHQRLDAGEVALAERVPEQDTDPRTEVGQVGLAINSMLDNVAGALQARQRSESRVRRFVADASHELRTPLASIRGYAELSRREREPVPKSVRHGLTRIESESLRMQGLVEDLLLLARLDDGRPLQREPVDLTMLAVTAVGDLQAASPDHHWRLDLPDEPVEVVGDADRLRQVLVNLLGNARRHTPEGTTVTTALRADSDEVTLTVADDGPGIPAQLQPEAFERFTRGDDSRNRAGGSTGLGLSIVRSVTEAHGGSVELRSEPGSTVFTVRLPAPRP